MKNRLRCVTLLVLLGLFGQAGASGLQVAPISLQLQARQNADGLWLSNTGDELLHAQVRVYHWTQAGGEEQLSPSRALVLSPPMLQVAAGDRQLVRVIRVAAPPSGTDAVEDAYRVIVDELPVDTANKEGVNFVLHYSVPVFVEPVGKSTVAPQLGWTLHRDGDHVVLEVRNSGDGHARISQLDFTGRNGSKSALGNGLFGYVLPGATMRWILKPPANMFADGGTFHAKVNDEAVTQPVSLDTTAR